MGLGIYSSLASPYVRGGVGGGAQGAYASPTAVKSIRILKVISKKKRYTMENDHQSIFRSTFI